MPRRILSLLGESCARRDMETSGCGDMIILSNTGNLPLGVSDAIVLSRSTEQNVKLFGAALIMVTLEIIFILCSSAHGIFLLPPKR